MSTPPPIHSPKPGAPKAKTARELARSEWERREAVPALPPTPEDAARMRRMSRRSFLWAGVVTAGTLGGLWAFNRNPPDDQPNKKGLYVPLSDGAKAPLRAALNFNEAVARGLFFSPEHRAKEFPRSAAEEPRNNYKGDTPTVDLDSWKMKLQGEQGRDKPRFLTMKDIRSLPEVSQTTELKCIEGWSTVVHWTGVRFYDFLKKFPPPPEARYIALFSEPEGWENEWYYVGLDIESAMHPQTLLAYSMNDEPLSSEHGAPLRLAIPHKYGIKNIKLITRIAYTTKRPTDYWYEQGYDWYAGV